MSAIVLATCVAWPELGASDQCLAAALRARGQGGAYNRRVSAVELERVARVHGIRLLLQFGSTVTGHVHAKSDIDVAVLLDHRKYLELERRFVADAVRGAAGRG